MENVIEFPSGKRSGGVGQDRPGPGWEAARRRAIAQRVIAAKEANKKLSKTECSRIARNLHALIERACRQPAGSTAAKVTRTQIVSKVFPGETSPKKLYLYQLPADMELASTKLQGRVDGLQKGIRRYVDLALACAELQGWEEDAVLEELVEGVSCFTGDEAAADDPHGVFGDILGMLRAGTDWVIREARLDEYWNIVTDQGLLGDPDGWRSCFSGSEYSYNSDGRIRQVLAAPDEIRRLEPSTPILEFRGPPYIGTAIVAEGDEEFLFGDAVFQLVHWSDLVITRSFEPTRAWPCLRTTPMLSVCCPGREPKRIEFTHENAFRFKLGSTVEATDGTKINLPNGYPEQMKGSLPGPGKDLYLSLRDPEVARILQRQVDADRTRTSWCQMISEGASLAPSGSGAQALDRCLRGGASLGHAAALEPDGWMDDPAFAPPAGWPDPERRGPIEHLYVQARLLSDSLFRYWEDEKQRLQVEAQRIIEQYQVSATAGETAHERRP